MRGMQMDEFGVSEGKYRSPMLGSWEIEQMGQPREAVYCEVPEDIHALQALLNTGYDKALFVRENSPVFLLPKDRTKEHIYLGTVAKVKEDTGRHRMRQWPAAKGEISEVVDSIEDVIDMSDEVVEEHDVVSMLTSDTSVKQIRRFQECAIFENYFGNNKELGLSVDYFKKNQNNGKGFSTDFRYRRRQKKGAAGTWVSKDYVQEAVDAMREYAILKDVCVDSGRAAGSTEEVSRQWNEIVKSINGMRTISQQYFTEEAKKEFKDFAAVLLEKKALDLAGYARHDGIDKSAAQQAFAWLLKSNHPKRVNRALDIAERYIPGAIDIAKKRIKDVAFRNDALYGSPFPPTSETIQLEARMDAPKSGPRKVSQSILKDAGYRSAGYDDLTKNVRIRNVVQGIDHPKPRDIYNRLLSRGRTDDIEKAIQIANKFLTPDDARHASTYWKSASRRYNAEQGHDSWKDGDVLFRDDGDKMYRIVCANDEGKLPPLRQSTLPPKPPIESAENVSTPPPLPWQAGGSGAYERPASKPPTIKSTLPPRPVLENRASTPPPINAEERRASGLPPLRESSEHSKSGVRIRADAYIPWADEADVQEICEIRDTPPPIPAAAKKKARASSLPPPPPSIMQASRKRQRETILPPALPSLKMLPEKSYVSSASVNAA